MEWSVGITNQRKHKHILLGILGFLLISFCICYNQFFRYNLTQDTYFTSVTFWESELVEINSKLSRGVLVTPSDGYGLGNHLFYYAISYALSRNLRIPLIISLPSETHIKNLKNFTDREFVLNHFSLPKGIYMEDKEIQKTDTPYQVSCEMAKDVSLIPKEILRKTKYFEIEIFCFDEQFFEEYEVELQEITVKVKKPSQAYTKWKELISSTEWPIAVHVRRGDIEKQYWSAPVQYFQDALRRMKKEVPRGIGKKVFIFSDDIEWAKENLVGEGFFPAELGWSLFFVSGSFGGLTNLEELDLMIKCKSIVISNSTFSWWAAFLMKNTRENKKIVIRPQFNGTKHQNDPLGWNGKKRRDYDISYPKEWIPIDT